MLLFNIAAVLGPRWIAAAAHNGASSIRLWILAAVRFFVPTALVVVELSSRFPEEGGLYAWSKDAFGDFHGFVAGWTYWIYSIFYFPGLLLASAAMSAYVVGNRARICSRRTALSCWRARCCCLLVAVVLNIVGLNIGKWLQNAGGVGTYRPVADAGGRGALIWRSHHGSLTHFTLASLRPASGIGIPSISGRSWRSHSPAWKCVHDERGNPRSPQDTAARHLRFGRADRR